MGDNGRILLSFASGSCDLKFCSSEAKMHNFFFANISFLLSFYTSVFNSNDKLSILVIFFFFPIFYS